MAAATSATQDHYEVLGVARTCDADTLKAAWRVAARRTHPDAGGSAADFERAHRAWEVLADPVARADYDRDLRARERITTPATPRSATARPTTSRPAPVRTDPVGPATVAPDTDRRTTTSYAATSSGHRPWRVGQAWRSGLLLLAAAAACVLAAFPVSAPDWFVHIDALAQAGTLLKPWTPWALVLLVAAVTCWVVGVRGTEPGARFAGKLTVPLALASAGIAAGPLLLAGVITTVAAAAVVAAFALAARVIIAVLGD